MVLSLRDIVRRQEGITGGFSFIHDVIPVLQRQSENSAFGIPFRNANGSISLRFVLSPPPSAAVSFFKVSPAVVTEQNPAVTLSWNVESPLPQNTAVNIFAMQNAPFPDGLLIWQRAFSELIDTLPDNAESPTTFYAFNADVVTPGGVNTVTAKAEVQVISTTPPPPPPPVEANLVGQAYYTDEEGTQGITLHQGDAFVVHFQVENAGTKATGPFQVSIILDSGAQTTVVSVASLPPGASTDVYWNFPGGLDLQDPTNLFETFEFTATLDPQGVVPEAPRVRTLSVGIIVNQ